LFDLADGHHKSQFAERSLATLSFSLIEGRSTAPADLPVVDGYFARKPRRDRCGRFFLRCERILNWRARQNLFIDLEKDRSNCR